jgi:hypothetical protein
MCLQRTDIFCRLVSSLVTFAFTFDFDLEYRPSLFGFTKLLFCLPSLYHPQGYITTYGHKLDGGARFASAPYGVLFKIFKNRYSQGLVLGPHPTPPEEE